MEKIDIKKLLPELYAPTNDTWQELIVPTMNFLMIDGAGDPNTSPEYATAVETLYSVAYPLKFMSKKELGRDYIVQPLEGLWYADDMSVFESFDKAAYKWTMMIMQPEWITDDMFGRALKQAKIKKPHLRHDMLRFEAYDEGRSLQLLHRGSYDDEAPKLYKLHHEIMPAGNLLFNGHHHEIYLSDPRRVVSEKLKTIVRQPIKEDINGAS